METQNLLDKEVKLYFGQTVTPTDDTRRSDLNAIMVQGNAKFVFNAITKTTLNLLAFHLAKEANGGEEPSAEQQIEMVKLLKEELAE